MSLSKRAYLSDHSRLLEWTDRVQNWETIQKQLAQPIILPFPVKIHVIRHGETETNAQSLITGASDVLLTFKGKIQAKKIGEILDSHYDMAFHSTLSRSSETLRLALAAGKSSVDHTFSDPRLNERSLGCLEGQPWQPIEEYAQGDFNFAPPGGENYLEVTRRTLSFLLDLAEIVCLFNLHTVLISGHMGSMRIMRGILEEQHSPTEVLASSFRNAELVRFDCHRLVFPEFLRDLRLRP